MEVTVTKRKRTVDNQHDFVEENIESKFEKVKEKINKNFYWMEKPFREKLIDSTLVKICNKQFKKCCINDGPDASFHVPNVPNKFKEQRSGKIPALQDKSAFYITKGSNRDRFGTPLQRLQIKPNGTDFKCEKNDYSSLSNKLFLDSHKKLSINSPSRNDSCHDNQSVEAISKGNETIGKIKPPNFTSILNKQQQKMPLSSTPVREPSVTLNTTESSLKSTSSKPSFIINETVKIVEREEYRMLIEQFSQDHLFTVDRFPMAKKYSSYCKMSHSSGKILKDTAFDGMKEKNHASSDTYKMLGPIEFENSKSIKFENDEPLILEVKPGTERQFTPKMKSSPYMSSEWIQELKKTMNEKVKEREKRAKEKERQIKEYEKKAAERKEKQIKEYKRKREERLARLKKGSQNGENFSLDGYGIENVLFENERVILPELTPEMNKVIDKALVRKHPDAVISTYSNFTVLYKDLETLFDCNWINDEIINTYLYLIQQRSKLPEYPSVYAFSSFFYTKLKNQGHSAVKRWTRKEDIFKYDMNLVPLHLGVHWCLAVIDHKHKKIGYYDSMLGKNNSSLSILREYLISECKDKKQKEFDTTGWTFELVKDIPPQLNGCDCGMFTLKYAEYIARNAEINFTQQYMPYFRKKTMYEIIVGHLVPDF